MTEEEPKRGRGRPRKYNKKGDRQKTWKVKTGFEASEKRRAYKAENARKRRAKKKLRESL